MGPLATPGATAQQLLPMEAPAARRLLKAASVETVELAGIRTLKILVMVNTRKKFPRGISDQVISNSSATARAQRAPGPGLKHQASSTKLQAFEPTCSSIKHQASSSKQQASSFKPKATSSEIREPRYMDIGEVLEEQGPRALAMINVLSG